MESPFSVMHFPNRIRTDKLLCIAPLLINMFAGSLWRKNPFVHEIIIFKFRVRSLKQKIMQNHNICKGKKKNFQIISNNGSIYEYNAYKILI